MISLSSFLSQRYSSSLKKDDTNIKPNKPDCLEWRYTETQKAVKLLKRAPVADLIFFPELSEANPLAEEDFFRNPLTEEERKGVLYSCPKSNFMHYLPPALNDTASTAVKKVDTTLYDFYIYKKVQNNPEGDHSEDPNIKFALEMRLLLADAASGITQSRRDLVYNTMELPGNFPKFNEEQDDSLFNSEEFNAIVEANRKARKRPVRSKGPFLQRQQVASASPLQRRKINKLPQLSHPANRIMAIKDKIFGQEGKKRFPNRIGKLFNRWRSPISFSGGMVKIDRQPMGQKGFFGRFSNSIQSIIRKPDNSYPRFPAPTLSRTTPQNLSCGALVGRAFGSTNACSAGAQFFPSGKIAPAIRAGLRTNVNYTSSSLQKKGAQSRKRFDNNRSSRTIIKARDRESKKANSWFLQSLIHNPKKYWGIKTSTRLAKIKQTRSTTTFQNEIIDSDMQDDIEERLYDINRFTRCVTTYSYSREMQEIPEIPMEWENIPVQSAFFRSFSQPFSLYQDNAPDNNLGTSLGNKDCVLFGQHHNIGGKPTNIPGENQYSAIKAQRTRISDQGLKIISFTKTDHQTPGNAYQLQADDSESSSRKGLRLENGGIQIDNQGENYAKRASFIHWEVTSNGCSTTPRMPNAEEIVGTEKQSLVKNIRF
ncbi:hypothetical protein AYI68_g285 [Smittium mucronatum]|uniref:Uncharacterized protein n=1 Tax=Smittium mucronatum TaxID=133383 RepID=A0A1R0H8S6_9FUNG|nr:hypothetical protein AYI68_g285 [Smittium mucronatum]